MLNFDVLEKGVRVLFFNDILWIIFWEKKILLYLPTKFHCLIALTYWDIL